MSRERTNNSRQAMRAWLFLIFVAGLFVATSLFSPAVASKALGSLGSLLTRVIPALGLVFCLIFLANLFLERKRLVRYLGKASGVRGWALAVISGVLLVGPLHAWYPLLGDLKAKGMSSALIATFLYARALKLPLLPLMVHYFGVEFTVTLSVCIVVFSVLSGLLMKGLSGLDRASTGGNGRDRLDPGQSDQSTGAD